MRRIVGICVPILLAAVAHPGVPSASSIRTVAVKDNYFSPSPLRVRRGEKVSWRWRGHSAHNVVGNGWHSPTMRRGTFSRAFRRAGTYRYVCTLHARMVGKIVVE